MAKATCSICENSFKDGDALLRHRKNTPACQDAGFKAKLAAGPGRGKKKVQAMKMASLEAHDELVAHAEEDYLHVLTEQIGSLRLEIRRVKAQEKVLELAKKYRSKIARRLGIKEGELQAMDQKWQRAKALKLKTK